MLKKDDKKNRDSNFELLRLFLILFVIILHYNGSICDTLGLTNNASFPNKYFIRIGESLCVCAVNVFLILSGYFMCIKTKVNVRKVIDLFSIVIVFTFASFALRIFFNLKDFSFKSLIGCLIPVNYYAYLYSAVFLLSPFLNLVINLEKKIFNHLVLILLALFSIFPTVIDFFSGYIPQITSAGRSFISADGNGMGYTLINFCLLYFIGAFIRKNECALSPAMSFWGYVFSTAMILIGFKLNPVHKFDYCNIFVISQASFFFLIFRNFSIKNRAVNFMARSVWGIFIIHFAVMECIKKFFDIESSCSGSFWNLVGVTVLIVILTFVVSMLLDMILRLMMKPLYLLFDKIPFFNKYIITLEIPEE